MHSYLINLASRPDRLEKATAELNRIGIEAERFEAYTGDNRPLAFNKSQYYCIKKAVEAGHATFAIFEDDVAFTENAAELITDAMCEIPDSLSVLHLGCNIIGMSTTQWRMPHKYSEHLAFLYNCWQTHAIVWSKPAAEYVLNNFPYYTDEYEKEGLTIFDEWLRVNLYNKFPCFVMRPMVAYQRPDVSDIWQGGGVSDYTSCFHDGNKYLLNL
jgi:GR25 family glycosyltransferase involved in LPS biosynthesis